MSVIDISEFIYDKTEESKPIDIYSFLLLL